jgi:hypothetical protein
MVSILFNDSSFLLHLCSAIPGLEVLLSSYNLIKWCEANILASLAQSHWSHLCAASVRFARGLVALFPGISSTLHPIMRVRCEDNFSTLLAACVRVMAEAPSRSEAFSQVVPTLRELSLALCASGTVTLTVPTTVSLLRTLSSPGSGGGSSSSVRGSGEVASASELNGSLVSLLEGLKISQAASSTASSASSSTTSAITTTTSSSTSAPAAAAYACPLSASLRDGGITQLLLGARTERWLRVVRDSYSSSLVAENRRAFASALIASLAWVRSWSEVKLVCEIALSFVAKKEFARDVASLLSSHGYANWSALLEEEKGKPEAAAELIRTIAKGVSSHVYH